MTVRESAFLFECEGDELVGIIAAPEVVSSDLGVLVIVGGPQYRVGSHRQFVLLARQLADRGIPCMRFDCRGMGDSPGALRSFEEIGDDVHAAVGAFLERAPEISQVVVWGLCDGASAACFIAAQDERVAGMVLLNPWVKTEAGEARVLLRHYYLRRLLSEGFWRKLLSGRVSLRKSLGGLNGTVAQVRRGDEVGGNRGALTLPDRMALALRTAGKPFVVLLSERDYVARQFEQVVTHRAWDGIVAAREPLRIADADHTFSSAAWRDEVALRTMEWVSSLAARAKICKLKPGGES